MNLELKNSLVMISSDTSILKGLESGIILMCSLKLMVISYACLMTLFVTDSAVCILGINVFFFPLPRAILLEPIPLCYNIYAQT